jgi:hypothetical protein
MNSSNENNINTNTQNNNSFNTPKVKENQTFITFLDVAFGDCESCIEQKSIAYKDFTEGLFENVKYEDYVFKNMKKCVCPKFLHRLEKDTKTVEDSFYYIYVQGQGLKNVDKRTFIYMPGKVETRKDCIIKYPHGKPNITKETKTQKKETKHASFEGLFSTVTDTFSGFKAAANSIFEVINSINQRIKQIPAFFKYVTLIRSIFTPLVSCFALASAGFSLVNLVALCSNLLSVFEKIEAFDNANKTCTNVVNDLESECSSEHEESTEYYSSDSEETFENEQPINERLERLRQFLVTNAVSEGFHFEIFDALTLSMLYSSLPTSLAHIIKNIALFTNTKIADDTLYIATMFKSFSDLIYYLLNLGAKVLPASVVTKIGDMLEYTCFGKHAYCVVEMEEVCSTYNIKPLMGSNLKFQNRVLILNDHITTEFKNDFTYFNRNLALKHLLSQFNALFKLVKANRDITRVEPICLVLEGPPKSGKSQTLLRLVKLFQHAEKTVYSHVTPNTRVAKDFYDDYNNQDVFVMDDVGQMGGSQWTSVINLVSPVKYSLACANAELKQTKFMTSQFLLCTTNNLSNMQFQKDDGIAEPFALYRRCDIVDFSQCRVGFDAVNKVSRLYGTLSYKFFNLQFNQYQIGFNDDFVRYYPDIPHTINLDDYTHIQYEAIMYKWIMNVLSARLAIKKKEQEVISTFDCDDIMKNIRFESGMFSRLHDVCKIYFEFNLNAVISNLFTDALSNLFSVQLPRANEHGIHPTINFLTNLLLTATTSYYFYQLIYYLTGFIFSDNIDADFQSLQQTVADHKLIRVPKTYEECIYKQVKFLCLNIFNEEGEQIFNGHGNGLISGRNVVINSHYIAKTYDLNKFFIYLTVYSDFSNKMILYDKVECKVVYNNKDADVCILEMPRSVPSLLKDISHLLNIKNIKPFTLTSATFISPWGLTSLDEDLAIYSGSSHQVTVNNYLTFTKLNSIVYNLSSYGLCGSVIVSDGGIIGMHCAGGYSSKGEKTGLGVAMIWKKEVLQDIHAVLSATKNLTYNLDVNEVPGKENCSVVKMDNVDHVGNSIPLKSKYVLSSVAGIYPFEKVPANLAQPNVIKDLARKSYIPLKDVNPIALEYSKSYIQAILPTFTKVSEKHVVLGSEISNKINKDTSCGFSFPLGKEEYIDYEKGEYKPVFRERMENFKKSILAGVVDYRDCIFQETLKDELRLVEKKDKPRCFKMCPLTLTCLGREYFLDLLEKVSVDRHNNGIMVGLNPFKEFSKLAEKATRMGGQISDGDYKEWDGKMLAQFQQAVAEILDSKFIGSEDDHVILNFLFSVLNYTLTLLMNEILCTNHSCPSGSWMTAFYNCIINKSYGAYIFYICFAEHNKRKPTVLDYIINVFDAVYGDDKWMVITPKVSEFFNGQSFQKECSNIGLVYTAADKSDNIQKFNRIENTTFLKRGFRYHNEIGQVVCPLDTVSMKSTLNFVSDIDRKTTLTIEKLLNFQRELYLHPMYEEEMQYVKEYCKEHNIDVNFLQKDFLRELYINDPDAYAENLHSYIL